MTEPAKRPALGIDFDDLDDDTPPVTNSEAERAERKAVAKKLNEVSNAPKERKLAAHSRATSKAKADAKRTPESDFRRRRGRPTGIRHEHFSVRTTEEHLRFLYSLTDLGPGTVVGGFEYAIARVAEAVLEDPQYKGVRVHEETLELARALLKRFPD